MENREPQIPSENSKDEAERFTLLKKDIQTAKELEDSGESKEVHFRNVDITRLGPDDINLYGLFKDKKLTPDILAEYWKKLNQDGNENENSSQFGAWIGNLLTREENMEWFNPEFYTALQRMKEKREARKAK